MDEHVRNLITVAADNGLAVDQFMGLDAVSVAQCREVAKLIGYNQTTFDLVGPLGRRRAYWLDAYYGMFQVEGTSGFMMMKDVDFMLNLWCENIRKGSAPEAFGPKVEGKEYQCEDVPAKG